MNYPRNSAAFAFDIDGVLVNGKIPIPEARETLARLKNDNIPFILLTNSGGCTEKDNLDRLSLRLGNIEFDEDQIVQSHTPFRVLVNEYKNKTVLVLGGVGDSIRNVAREYGFEDVITSSDLVVSHEHIHPFPEMTCDHHKVYGRKIADNKPRQIAAIMVWSSPRDWCLDLQVTLDLLLSDQGVVNTRSPNNGNLSLPNRGYQGEGQPKLFFCNPDVHWSTQHEHPRLAQGAFREALQGLWNHATGGAELTYWMCGKPTSLTYEYGERALQERGGEAIRTVYMIGDNVDSDIQGANSYSSQCGYRWCSILVETGIHKAGTCPSIKPTHVARNVAEAVQWALVDDAKNREALDEAKRCS